MRRFFRFFNRLFMVPMFRLGLGPLFGNPLAGYVMVMRVVGRKTGKVRFVPVNYAIQHGSIYCLVGFGRQSPWFLNLQANPEVEIILPGGAVAGHAEEATDPAERMAVVRQILKNAGFAAVFEGLNPYRSSDAVLAAKTAEQPLLRIRPSGLANGPADPGGLAWIWSVVGTVAVVALVVALVF